MPAAVGAGVGVVLVLLVLVAMAVKVVPGDTAFVVERFSRYSRTLAPGVTLTVPFADRVKARVSLLPHQLALAPTKVMAADGHWFSVSPAVTYAVADPVLATYAVASFHLSLQQLAATAVRKLASGLDASALGDREELRAALADVLGDAAREWGLRVTGVEVPAIQPAEPPER